MPERWTFMDSRLSGNDVGLVKHSRTLSLCARLPYGARDLKEIFMANPIEQAWAQGHKTGLNGKPETLCPFKKGMAQQAWMQGWQEGAKAHAAKSA